MKKMILFVAGIGLAVCLTACSGESKPVAESTEKTGESITNESSADKENAEVVLQVAIENSASEPVGQGFKKAQELIDEKSNGEVAIELYPD